MNNPTNAFPADNDIEKAAKQAKENHGGNCIYGEVAEIEFKEGAKYAREKTKAYYENEIKKQQALIELLAKALDNADGCGDYFTTQEANDEYISYKEDKK